MLCFRKLNYFKEKDLKYNIIDEYAFVDNEEEEEDYSDILDQELINQFNKEKEEKEKKFKKLNKKWKPTRNY